VESRPRVVVLPHNLPLQLSSLVGRKREISQVSVLLRNARLLTLCGPGGIGKARLALAVAEAMLDEFPQGTVARRVGQSSGPAAGLSCHSQGNGRAV
jgi:ABC-type dipeptide/oligopeptide/nickel transport system ATPase subunit